MSNSSEFDLNAAIRTWRLNLSQSPQFRAENLDELEAHLRDAIATMQGQRLTDEEVFLVATRRLGGVHALEPEFAKINAREVWLNRALWMLLGVQLWPLLSGFARLASEFVVVGGLLGFGRNLNPAPSQAWAADIAVFFGAVHFLMLVLVLWYAFRFVERREQGLVRWASHVVSRPRLIGLLVVAAYVVLAIPQFLGGVEWVFLRSKLSVSQVGLVGASRIWGSFALGFIQTLAFLVGTALLARRLFMKKLQTG